MGKLIAGGDSYIWGNELSDDDGSSRYSTRSWPALLANYLGYEYVCKAQYGDSNGAISRHVLNACEQHKDSDLIVVVQWTFGGRYEFRMRYATNQIDSPWYSISGWTKEEDMSVITESFQTMNQEILDSHIAHIKQAKDLGIADFARSFYDHVGDSEYYEIYSTLKEIVFLQNYLEIKKIPFLFTASNSTLFKSDVFTITHADETITALLDQINWDKWFKFPGKTHPVGFYRWARENNYPIGTTHPLDEAHIDAFNLIKKRFTCE
jgi:hypothetical protein